MSAPIVVVGAGFGGLSAACHLRRLGHEVTLFEAAGAPGGRAGLVHHDGYRFDSGPTVVTMVDLVRETFAAVGAELDDFCSLTRLDTAYRANFADGSKLSVRADLDSMIGEVERFSGRADADGFRRFVAWTGELYRLEFERFIAADVRGVGDLAEGVRPLLGLVAAGGFRSWWGKVSTFFTDDRLRRLFSFQAMYAGLSPLEALGLFAVIAHMDTVQGVYSVVGGVQALAGGLADAAVKAGVQIHYDAPVVRISTDRGSPAVHFADGSVVLARAVVANPDLPIVYDSLLDVTPPRSLRRAHYSPSCMVWHLALRGAVPEGTAHHNIHFGTQWANAFDELLVHGRPMTDPSRFVTVASLSDPTAAPTGGHSAFVLEPVPNLGADVDWRTETPRLTERMLRWAESAGYPIADAEVVTVVDPPGWRSRGAARGTPFSIDHRFSQSGPFRPGPEDPRAPGVVFCGAGTRPGIGVPMVLISGANAAERAHRFVTRTGQRSVR